MKFKILLFSLFLTFALRIVLSPLALHDDLVSNAEWGQWIYENGTKGFFENSIWTYSWPTQPPLANLLFGGERHLYQWLLEIFRNIGHTIVAYHLAPGHMRWWFNFTVWFDQAKFSPVIVFPKGYIAVMKLLPILADLGIAGILYFVAEKIKKGKGLVYSTIYLLSPFSWYLSSLWGQTDQLAFLFVLIAYVAEFQKIAPFFTPLLFTIGILIKPTSLILLPLFIWIYLKNNHKKTQLILSFFLAFGAFWVTTKAFSGNLNPLFYAKEMLFPKVFLKSEFRVSTNAFNFWRVFIGNKALSDKATFLLLPARIWGVIVFTLLNLFAIKLTKKGDLKRGFSALFIVSAGSYLFMTNMLDRYFFAGILSGLFVCIYYPKLLKYWFVMSLIFWVNLFNQWWYPEWLKPLQTVLTWQEGLVTRILAFSNVAIFLFMSRKVIRKPGVNV